MAAPATPMPPPMSLGRAGEKIYNQSTLKLAVLKQSSIFKVVFYYWLVTLKYIFLYLEAANIGSIPAAVLRHKTARNTIAGMRSISTNLKCRVIATMP